MPDSALPARDLSKDLEAFTARDRLGKDPLAELYSARRRAWSLFAANLSDAECEGLRPYLFSYRKLARRPGEPAPRIHNFIDGEWQAPSSNEYAALSSPADDRVTLFNVAASNKADRSRRPGLALPALGG